MYCNYWGFLWQPNMYNFNFKQITGGRKLSEFGSKNPWRSQKYKCYKCIYTSLCLLHSIWSLFYTRGLLFFPWNAKTTRHRKRKKMCVFISEAIKFPKKSTWNPCLPLHHVVSSLGGMSITDTMSPTCREHHREEIEKLTGAPLFMWSPDCRNWSTLQKGLAAQVICKD